MLRLVLTKLHFYRRFSFLSFEVTFSTRKLGYDGDLTLVIKLWRLKLSFDRKLPFHLFIAW